MNRIHIYIIVELHQVLLKMVEVELFLLVQLVFLELCLVQKISLHHLIAYFHHLVFQPIQELKVHYTYLHGVVDLYLD
jgi:hypothetical protein